jgi:hypothetical protein
LLKKDQECFENLSMNGKYQVPFVRPEPRRRTPKGFSAGRYIAMKIYPKGVTPECLTPGPVSVFSGFPIEAFGNDGL